MQNQATVKILGEVVEREIPTKNGPKKVYEQKAQVETEQMRVQIDVGVDGPKEGYQVGLTYAWDVVADLVPGRFGLELARRMSLRPLEAMGAKVAVVGAK